MTTTPEEAMEPLLAAVTQRLSDDIPVPVARATLDAVRDATVALMVGELEATGVNEKGGDISIAYRTRQRLAEWRAARSECTCQSASMKVCPTHGLGTEAWSAR